MREMQSIGLKDKNGAEIYEGDIVCIEPLEIKARISYNSFDASYFYYCLEDNYRMHRIGNFESEELEVIGNIYENKELLK